MIKGSNGHVGFTFTPCHANHTCLSVQRSSSATMRDSSKWLADGCKVQYLCRGNGLQTASKSMLSSSHGWYTNNATDINVESRTVHRVTSSPVPNHVFQHVYTSRVAHIPPPQREIWMPLSNGVHLPKFRSPPCDRKHAVAVLASINDAARQPRVQHGGCKS
jgi:hypothetical protein